MLTEESGNTREYRIKKHHLVSLFMALVFAAMIYPNPAHGQLVGSMEPTSRFNSTLATRNFRQANTSSACWTILI